jgi:aldose 1-epimerase
VYADEFFTGLTSMEKTQDILLGYDSIENWFEDQSFFGSTAGRCCNRIRDSKFKIGNQEFILASNVPPHHLHGGFFGV